MQLLLTNKSSGWVNIDNLVGCKLISLPVCSSSQRKTVESYLRMCTLLKLRACHNSFEITSKSLCRATRVHTIRTPFDNARHPWSPCLHPAFLWPRNNLTLPLCPCIYPSLRSICSQDSVLLCGFPLHLKITIHIVLACQCQSTIFPNSTFLIPLSWMFSLFAIYFF